MSAVLRARKNFFALVEEKLIIERGEKGNTEQATLCSRSYFFCFAYLYFICSVPSTRNVTDCCEKQLAFLVSGCAKKRKYHTQKNEVHEDEFARFEVIPRVRMSEVFRLRLQREESCLRPLSCFVSINMDHSGNSGANERQAKKYKQCKRIQHFFSSVIWVVG